MLLEWDESLIPVIAVADVALLFTWLFAIVSQWRLESYLKLNHHQLWQLMGKPGRVAGFPTLAEFASPWLVLGFVLRRDYRRIDDPKLHKLGNTAFLLMLFAWLSLAVVVLLPHRMLEATFEDGGRWFFWI